MTPTPLSILLADDNPANQKVLQYMLERLGHRVTIVSTGITAVSACAAADFDLRTCKKRYAQPQKKSV